MKVINFLNLSLIISVVVLAGCGTSNYYKSLEKGPVGRIYFDSLTIDQTQFLQGVKKGKKVKLFGDLNFPESTKGKIPAVILVHGSAGVSKRELNWALEIRQLGFATFVIDCFTPRGIRSTAEEQFQLKSTSMIKDAYKALEILSTHPKIDSSRIAIMGFSKGGIVSLYSSLYRFYRNHGPQKVIFAAHISFYPSCSYTFIDELDTSFRPIRIFIGTEDDYVGLTDCEEYVEKLKRIGKNAEIIKFRGAKHQFDNPTSPNIYLPKIMNLSKCKMVEEKEGVIVDKDTGEKFSPKAKCIYQGAHIGYNEESFNEAKNILTKFLTGL